MADASFPCETFRKDRDGTRRDFFTGRLVVGARAKRRFHKSASDKDYRKKSPDGRDIRRPPQPKNPTNGRNTGFGAHDRRVAGSE
ncbi:hypothetical protein JCM19992_10160 [Thermostilla marina]